MSMYSFQFGMFLSRNPTARLRTGSPKKTRPIVSATDLTIIWPDKKRDTTHTEPRIIAMRRRGTIRVNGGVGENRLGRSVSDSEPGVSNDVLGQPFTDIRDIT